MVNAVSGPRGTWYEYADELATECSVPHGVMLLSRMRLRAARTAGRPARPGVCLLRQRGMATTKQLATTTQRIEESTAPWCERWKQLVEWEQAADTAASQSRIAHWSKKRLRAEGHMMVRDPCSCGQHA